MKWKHFVAASLVVGAAMLKQGIPVAPVLGGVLAALLIGVWKMRRAA